MQRWCVCSRTSRQLFICPRPVFQKIGKPKFGGYKDGSRYPKSHNQMEHHRKWGSAVGLSFDSVISRSLIRNEWLRVLTN